MEIFEKQYDKWLDDMVEDTFGDGKYEAECEAMDAKRENVWDNINELDGMRYLVDSGEIEYFLKDWVTAECFHEMTLAFLANQTTRRYEAELKAGIIEYIECNCKDEYIDWVIEDES